jgi:hypothetical protein
VAVSFCLYGVAIRAPFLFDDDANIVSNTNLAQLLESLLVAGPRGVGYLSFALNHAFSGLDPAPYRATNIVIHALNGLLVYRLVRQVADHFAPPGEGGTNRELAAAVALLFLVHPVQTGAVTYVVQRFTSLSTLFYLLSFTCFLSAAKRYRRGGRFPDRRHLVPYAAAVVSAVLAMKTKEIAFTLPLAIFAWETLFRRKGSGNGERPLPLPYFLPFALSILVVPVQFLGTTASIGELLGEVGRRSMETTEIGRWQYLLTETRVLVTYVRLLFVPVGQNLDYDFAVSNSILEPAVLLSIAFHAFLVASAVRIHRRNRSGLVLLVPFGVLWFYLTLSVESTFVPIHDVIFEHRMYLPSPGMIAAAAGLFVTAAGRLSGDTGRKALPWLFVASLLVLSALTISRNLLWSDGIGIWRDTVAKSPGKARPRKNLGVALDQAGKSDEAIAQYLEAIRIEPHSAVTYANLGTALYESGRKADAIACYRTALRYSPGLAEAHLNLGIALEDRGNAAEAILHYREALRLRPGLLQARDNLESLLLRSPPR